MHSADSNSIGRFNMDNDDLGLSQPISNDVQDAQFVPARDLTTFPDMAWSSQASTSYAVNPSALGTSFPNPPSDLFPSVDASSVTPASLSYQLMGSNAPVPVNNRIFNGFNSQYLPQQYGRSCADKEPGLAPSSFSQGDSGYPGVDDPGGKMKPVNMPGDTWSLDGSGRSLDQADYQNVDSK